MPQKVNNSNWRKVGVPAFEDSIRFEIGTVVAPSAIATIPELIDASCDQPEAFRDKIRSLRDRSIYNVGTSSEAAASYLAAISQSAG